MGPFIKDVLTRWAYLLNFSVIIVNCFYCLLGPFRFGGVAFETSLDCVAHVEHLGMHPHEALVLGTAFVNAQPVIDEGGIYLESMVRHLLPVILGHFCVHVVVY